MAAIETLGDAQRVAKSPVHKDMMFFFIWIDHLKIFEMMKRGGSAETSFEWLGGGVCWVCTIVAPVSMHR